MHSVRRVRRPVQLYHLTPDPDSGHEIFMTIDRSHEIHQSVLTRTVRRVSLHDQSIMIHGHNSQ
jgi:hypothetical protein